MNPCDGPAFPPDLPLPGAPDPCGTQPDVLRRDDDAYREAAAAVE